MYISLHVKYPLLMSDFNATRIFSTDFRKIPQKIKFHKNQSGRSRVIPFGQTDGET